LDSLLSGYVRLVGDGPLEGLRLSLEADLGGELKEA
jgi:hypothetical protein